MQILLYSYCKCFQIDPYQAANTPLTFMVDMLLIHSEVESKKGAEIDKIRRQAKRG